MKKIPVIVVIRDAYRFTFENLGAIIGLIWMPMILLTVIGFFVMQRAYDAMADALASGNMQAMGPEMLGLFCYMVAALLLSTMMAVPVTQLALGQRKSGALLHFSFGGAEWRLFRGLVGLLGFLILLFLIISLISGLAPHVFSANNALMVVAGLYLLVCAAMIFFSLRFGFLLPVLAVSEDKALMPRAWSLTAGNFWRLFAVAIATAAPVVILASLAEAVIEGRQVVMPGMDASTAMMAAQFHALSMNMPIDLGIKFLIAPLLLGLSLSAGVGVYRSLTGSEVDITA